MRQRQVRDVSLLLGIFAHEARINQIREERRRDGHDVGVRDERALGQTRRATRVADRRQVLRLWWL